MLTLGLYIDKPKCIYMISRGRGKCVIAYQALNCKGYYTGIMLYPPPLQVLNLFLNVTRSNLTKVYFNFFVTEIIPMQEF